MNVAIVSDSHVPDREPEIPEGFRERMGAADRVIHAGDFEDRETLVDLHDLSTDLTAVRGNADSERLDLPSVAAVEADGVTLVVTHGAVNPATREPAVAADPDGWFDGEGVVVDGHDWLGAVATTARIVAVEGTTDAVGRASVPGPVDIDPEAAERIADAAAAAPDPEGTVVGIGGHSHRVVDDTHAGVRVLNPGTVTGADPGPRTTMMTLEVEGGDVDVTLHERDE